MPSRDPIVKVKFIQLVWINPVFFKQLHFNLLCMEGLINLPEEGAQISNQPKIHK